MTNGSPFPHPGSLPASEVCALRKPFCNPQRKNHAPASASPYLPFGENKNASWYGKDILSVKQFTRADLEYIFGVAHEMRGMVERIGTFDLLKGKILANLFYEPLHPHTRLPSRRRWSGWAARSSPSTKCATPPSPKAKAWPIPIRTLECYADVIVLRHPETGSAAIAAKAARKPVINAGDGIGEHPTQALLDAFTIFEELGEGQIDGMTVTLLGDLKYGRTVHSLARLLSLYNVKLNYVSPDILRMPKEVMDEVAEKGIPRPNTPRWRKSCRETDVLYVTRVQKSASRAGGVRAGERLVCH